MKFKKEVLGKMERCYSVACMAENGEPKLFYASEAPGSSCTAYSGTGFKTAETVWENAGGTMSMVEIPSKPGEFLAVQNFFPSFQCETAKIVWVKRGANGQWETKDLVHLPFVHRFDIFSVAGQLWLVCATLCTSKKDRADWSDPGHVYAGILPGKPEDGITLETILGSLTKNHGYCRAPYKGNDAAYIAAEDGIFVIVPPAQLGAKWRSEQIHNQPSSDVAVFDLDGDGHDELVVLAPFHGGSITVMKQIGSTWQEVYQLDGEFEFAHAIWAGTLRGRPCALVGMRRRECELFLIQFKNGNYVHTQIDSGGGPANVAVVRTKEHDIVLCANHTQNESVLYYFEEL